jgi:hypothetical protein
LAFITCTAMQRNGFRTATCPIHVHRLAAPHQFAEIKYRLLYRQYAEACHMKFVNPSARKAISSAPLISASDQPSRIASGTYRLNPRSVRARAWVMLKTESVACGSSPIAQDFWNFK